uniref:Reverse transcriptase domain-containing protein n=1 Tax=Fagus sylvatica TaxID=28930 RepID=A0A2N9I314_FAGSY
MNSHIEKVTVYSRNRKNRMIIPEGEHPLPEIDLSSNNDNRWPEGTPSEKALRKIIVRSEIRNEGKPESSHQYRKRSKTNQEIRVVEPKNSRSSSDRTKDVRDMDTVEALKQQVLELKKKLKKNKNSRRSQLSSRPKIRNRPKRSFSTDSSSMSIDETDEEGSSDGRKKGGRSSAWDQCPSDSSTAYNTPQFIRGIIIEKLLLKILEVYNEVDGGTEEMAIKTFKLGLDPEFELRHNLFRRPAKIVKKKNGKWRVCVDFTNLNQACPKDPFLLPKINQLVDATAGHDQMSFLDTFQGYHQIALSTDDREKTAFITTLGIYCYRVIPFGLKNVDATYQRMVTKMFKDQIGRTMKIYIDDMVVKSKLLQNHLEDLLETFRTLRQHKLRLNASKCVFGVGSGKFLGFMISHRGIEVNPDQIKAIRELKAPRTHKEVQRLIGMTIALNSPDPTEPLFLYLAVFERAVSAVLIRIKDTVQCPVYYTSKTMTDAEMCYPPLEKVGLALITAAKKLPQYFQAHTIYVWGAKIGALDVKYLPRTAIKGQVLADFVAEFTPSSGQRESSAIALNQGFPEDSRWWRIYVDGASNAKRFGTGVVIMTPNETTIPNFDTEKVEQIGRNLNNHVDALATLASALSADLKWSIPIETLAAPSITTPACQMNTIMIEIIEDLLYEMHEGICGSHTGGRSLAHRAFAQGCWWPYMQRDAVTYVKRCDKCQRFSHSVHQPAGELQPLESVAICTMEHGLGRSIAKSDRKLTLVEASNKTVLDGIKKRLEDAKGRWMEELSNILWTFRTTPRRSTGETPFSLAYGSEAVIPLEIGLPTLRTLEWEPTRNDLAQSQALDLLEERREQAMIRLASYQQQLKKGYNKNVRPRSFQQGDLVLRKVLGNTKNPNDGKLGPNWEGPYRVDQYGVGAYHLEDLNSIPLPRHGMAHMSEPTRDYWVGSDTICNNPRKALATSALIHQKD